MITAVLFIVFAIITILGMPIALALVGGGMAAIAASGIAVYAHENAVGRAILVA